MPTITIVNSNPATGALKLRPIGTVLAPRRETIKWVLGPNCRVDHISKIDVKHPSPINIIWQEAPHNIAGSHDWSAVIDRSTREHAEYNYFISWIPEGSSETKTFDPKIAVKPDKFNFTVLAITVASVFTAIFSMMLFRKRRKSK